MVRATHVGLILLLACFAASAQSGLAGRVLDPQGKAVVDAAVRVEIGGTIVADTRSGPQGAFALPDVAPGRYRLVVEASGFQPVARDVTTPSGVVTVCDITLA